MPWDLNSKQGRWRWRKGYSVELTEPPRQAFPNMCRSASSSAAWHGHLLVCRQVLEISFCDIHPWFVRSVAYTTAVHTHGHHYGELIRRRRQGDFIFYQKKYTAILDFEQPLSLSFTFSFSSLIISGAPHLIYLQQQ